MKTVPGPGLAREAAFLIGSGVIALHFTVSYVTHTTFYIDFDAWVDGTERLPFQYRALTAWLIAAGERWTGIDALAGRLPPPFDSARIVLLMMLTALSAWGAAIGVKAAAARLTGSWPAAVAAALALFLSLYFMLILPYSIHQFGYPYDTPQVLFFALGLLCIVGDRRIALGVTVGVATLNRETAVFLPVLYLLYHWGSRPLASLLRDAALLLVPFALVKAALFGLYAGNPREIPADFVLGGLFVNQLLRNVENLLAPQYWINFASVFAFLWVVVVAGWSRIPDRGIRRCFLVFVPWFAVMVVAGRLTEIRLWVELAVLVAVAVGFVVRAAVRCRPEERGAGA